jgi:fimbrial chaperone protein
LKEGELLRASALAVFALWFAASLAWAGSFEVNPIRVDLSAAANSAAVTVRNTGAESVVVQVSVQAWAQADGKDVLTPTSEVLISPPIATIAASQQQVIRIGLRRAPDAQKELSYRLFLQEVPPPPQPGFQGLQVALRIGMPIFVQPRSGPAKATLVWDAQLRADGNVSLRLQNKGTGHIQISDVALYLREGKEPVAAHSSLAYVLPGQSREWELKLTQPGVQKTDRLRLKVATDAGSVDTEIDLAP